MTNLNILETFRTKEELVNYFEEIGQSITEKEIENLKKSYNQAEKANSALTMQQLDDIAGGVVMGFIEEGAYNLNAVVGNLRLSHNDSGYHIELHRRDGRVIPIQQLPQEINLRQNGKTTPMNLSIPERRENLEALLNNGDNFCVYESLNGTHQIYVYNLRTDGLNIPQDLIHQALDVYNDANQFDVPLTRSERTQWDLLEQLNQ